MQGLGQTRLLPEIHLASSVVDLGTAKITRLVFEAIVVYRSCTAALVITLDKLEINKNSSPLLVKDVARLEAAVSVARIVEGLQGFDNRQTNGSFIRNIL